jgi:hypothetical protein
MFSQIVEEGDAAADDVTETVAEEKAANQSYEEGPSEESENEAPAAE